MPQNGCLRVLDPARGDAMTYGRQARFLVDAIPLSDPSNILLEDRTAKITFLSEPDHTWCYYFARAELAYQQRDWDQVIELIRTARSLGYAPEDPLEWLTYIEAQALAGDIEEAYSISADMLEQDNGTRRGLCVLWERVQRSDSSKDENAARLHQIVTDLECAR
jgi:hypothetical protein